MPRHCRPLRGAAAHVRATPTRSSPGTAVSPLMRRLLDKVAEQIPLDLWCADFPNTTIDEVVMNIDEGHKNPGTKRQGVAGKRVRSKEHKRTDRDKGEHVQDDVVSLSFTLFDVAAIDFHP